MVHFPITGACIGAIVNLGASEITRRIPNAGFKRMLIDDDATDIEREGLGDRDQWQGDHQFNGQPSIWVSKKVSQLSIHTPTIRLSSMPTHTIHRCNKG